MYFFKSPYSNSDDFSYGHYPPSLRISTRVLVLNFFLNIRHLMPKHLCLESQTQNLFQNSQFFGQRKNQRPTTLSPSWPNIWTENWSTEFLSPFQAEPTVTDSRNVSLWVHFQSLWHWKAVPRAALAACLLTALARDATGSPVRVVCCSYRLQWEFIMEGRSSITKEQKAWGDWLTSLIIGWAISAASL